jgi:hypothetical protein
MLRVIGGSFFVVETNQSGDEYYLLACEIDA